MSFETVTFGPDEYPTKAAQLVDASRPHEGSVVLTGGTTAERIYEALGASSGNWDGLDVYFSDERCVPPDDPASNFGMAARLLLTSVGAPRVHRMPGEKLPEEAAEEYGEEIASVAVDLMLLGMGADGHVGAMFPGSPAVAENDRLCVAVDRPDGMRGLTLTPPVLMRAKKVLLVVTGSEKAPTVARVIGGKEPVGSLPAGMLKDHPDATFVLDEEAASEL
ncbi:MAG: 6-phosphogluconolactonase [Actinobacteria bacterium]|nr:6-phosphogluconolactonase [Actinomycetota bacterium]